MINARGEELGEVDSIAVGPDRKRHAVLKVKGILDLFGLGAFDFGNELMVVPLDEIVAAKSRWALASDVTAERLIETAPYEPERFAADR